MHALSHAAWSHPAVFIAIAIFASGLAGGITAGVLAQDVSSVAMTAEALANIKLIARLQGFGAGCTGGFAFATVTYMIAYKQKADKFDKLMEELAKERLNRKSKNDS